MSGREMEWGKRVASRVETGMAVAAGEAEAEATDRWRGVERWKLREMLSCSWEASMRNSWIQAGEVGC